MLKNVSLLETRRDGVATWRLLGPNSLPLDSFTAFADSLIRKHPFNTRVTYCRHLAEFLDYLFEAASTLHAANPGKQFSRATLQQVIEAYETYLVFGGSSGNHIAILVDASKPSPRHSPITSALMHAPVRKFLRLSETLRAEMDELTSLGLRNDIADTQPLLNDLTATVPVTSHQRHAMAAHSMIAGLISGGPKLVRSAALPTVSPQVAYKESRAFPYDSIGDFIERLPTYRDKTLYALLAASGCRTHEGLQELYEGHW